MQPHRNRYWLNHYPKNRAAFEQQVREICQWHLRAAQLYERGTHVVSTDEMTGIQALEREYPTRGLKPERVERTEFNYIRHGTRSLIATWHVALGKVLCPYLGPTRKEDDFAEHIEQVIETDPNAHWCFIVDQLNTHKSETLVRLVAQRESLDLSLGLKGKSGILKSMASRMAFLSHPQRRIRFIYIPKHTSWLNQIECWFSILVKRLLKRGNFTSTNDLQQQILNFIDYFNRRWAKPFNWKFEGFDPVDAGWSVIPAALH